MVAYKGSAMNKRIPSPVKIAFLLAGLAGLFPLSGICADSASDSFTPSLAAPSAQEDTTVLNRRLLSAKKDLEQFLVFAGHFSSNGDMKTAEQLKSPADDYLKRHVNRLLMQGINQGNPDTSCLTAEIMFIKARFYVSTNQPEAAKATVEEIRKNFPAIQKNMIDISGKPTMLSEAVRQLDEELAKPARSINK